MRKLIHLFLLACMVSALAGVSIGASTAQADAGHVLTIDDLTVDEGDGGLIVPVTITAHVSPAPVAGERVKVDFGTSAIGGTAKSTASGDATPTFPEDFAQDGGTLTFDASDTTKTVAVSVRRDDVDEADETFFVNLFNARGECVIPLTCTTGATIGDAKATVTLVNDDTAPVLAVNDVSHDEGDENATTYEFTVTKTGGSGKIVTVAYATADDSATAPSDYTANSGTLTFPASDPLLPETQTVEVSANGDTSFEPDEAFTFTLSAPANATLGDAVGTGSIANDDGAPAPSVTVADATNAEGDDLGFIVTLSSPPGPGQTAVVDWATVAGESGATQGTDYPAALGSLVFTAGEAEQMITVPTTEDTTDESDETFGLLLTQPATSGTGGYTYALGDATSTGTITDDDDAPSFAVSDATVDPEGNSGDAAATFTVTKTGTSDSTSTVHYATVDNTATSADYTAAAGDLSFAPGDAATKQIVVPVLPDVLDEADETFNVNLSAPTNATVSDAQGVGTIKDDDASNVTLAVSNLSVTEGDSGTALANFAVTKTGTTGLPVTVQYATGDWSAQKGVDYDETTGMLTFAPGDTTKFVAVPVRGDTMDEVNETYTVNLSVPTNATISDALGAGIILDNDAAPAISIGNDSVSESASAACTVLVQLGAKSGREVNVNYTTVSGTAGTADYVAKSGTVKFVAGDTAAQIKIFSRADSKDESTEKFTVKLSGITPSGSATFADSSGTCSILDND